MRKKQDPPKDDTGYISPYRRRLKRMAERGNAQDSWESKNDLLNTHRDISGNRRHHAEAENARAQLTEIHHAANRRRKREERLRLDNDNKDESAYQNHYTP